MIVANVRRLYVVTSLQEPPVHNAFIDRVLVSAERGEVKSSIVLNKMDLIDSAQADEFAAVYESCGYPVLRTSAVTGEGTDALASELEGDVYAFVGVSGVGKSSLLNRIDPALDIKTREVGEKTGRGRHTTTNSQLYRFRGGWLADTPGMQIFGFAGSDRNELAGCFPEMREFEGECRFDPCMHSHEPGCAVKDALDGGSIAASRYESYLKILAEMDERKKRRR
jgi:ribosome biogenesis GTPase